MQLHETGGDRARLYIPAEIRDEFDLCNQSEIGIQIKCENHRPVVHLIPSNNGLEIGVSRPVTVKSNGQAQVDFPRQIAETMGLLDTEIELVSEHNRLIIRRVSD